jgi:uncharacterized protein (TIGR02147 family)
MLNIDEMSDYRDLLKNFYVQKKLDMPLYSYKMMGQKIGLDTTQVFRVLNKELHLPSRCIPLVKGLLGLKGRDGEMFEILVAASKTKSQAKKDKLYKMVLALRDVEMREMDSNEILFLSKWWIPVVRALIELEGKTTPISRLVKKIRPAISKEQADEAIRVLRELKLITPLASEKYAATQVNFTAVGDGAAKAIRSYQNQLLGLAQDALVSVKPDQRSISSLLLGVDDDGFSDITEMTHEFRRLVQKRADEIESPTKVMQFVFSLYPVADVAHEKKSDDLLKSSCESKSCHGEQKLRHCEPKAKQSMK